MKALIISALAGSFAMGAVAHKVAIRKDVATLEQDLKESRDLNEYLVGLSAELQQQTSNLKLEADEYRDRASDADSDKVDAELDQRIAELGREEAENKYDEASEMKFTGHNEITRGDSSKCTRNSFGRFDCN